MRPKPRFWVLVAALVGVVGATAWYFTRPEAKLLPPPALTPALRQAVLAAVAPGWPQQKPTFAGPLGPIRSVDGRVDGVAAADVDGDGTAEWGVTYAWLGPKDPSGTRHIQVGFAVLAAGDAPELLYLAPTAGGWNGPRDAYFADASGATARVEAVSLGSGALGFMQHLSAEMAVGGRLTSGSARLFAPHLGDWSLAWEGETEYRWRAGTAEETSRTADVKLEDTDGDGAAEVVTRPAWYHRHLGRAGKGPHFTAGGLGRLIHRRASARYALSGLQPDAGELTPVRSAAPLLAARTRAPIVVDGRFGDWEPDELVALTGLRFEDPALLKYKRRDRHGIEDFSGDVRLMWDLDALYVRAAITDDTVTPGPAGRELYQGDHLALWLDWDLKGDFKQDVRSADDWQIGLTPGVRGTGPQSYVWVPKAGTTGIRVASRPLVDPYSGGVNGYELEAAIPWATLGGLPPGTRPGRTPGAATGPMRHYDLTVAGVMGFGAVLTDSDQSAQELVYVSNPGFTWSAPRSFNTLLLVEGQPGR